MYLPERAETAPGGSAGNAPGAERRKRLAFIEALRAIAILIVVATHVRDPFPVDGLIRSEAFGIVFRHINLIFIFVSGFLFQYLLHRFRYGSYIKGKLRNVVLPYLVMSIPALLIYGLGLKQVEWPASMASGALGQLGIMVVTGSQLAPFWFIPMMCLFYLVSPLLAKMDRWPKSYLFILPLLVVSMVVGRSPGDADPAQNFLFYLPVYLTGMAMAHFHERTERLPGWIWTVLTLCLFVPFAYQRPLAPWWDDFLFLTKIAFCLGLTGLLQRYVTRVPAWLRQIGDISFAIFFVHYYAVGAISQMVARDIFGGRLYGLPMYLLSLVVVFTASILASLLVKDLAGRHSRMIIGA